jgi:hypothetical protein
MNRIELNEIPESEKPQLLYQIEVLALTFAMLGALFPWSDGPLSNWMIWLGRAMTLNAIAANIYPTRTWTERQSVLLTRLGRFRLLSRREEQTISGPTSVGGK